MEAAIGLVELNSVAKGIETCDAMLKVAGVELVEAHPTCPGKYIILITGLLASVEEAVSKGIDIGGEYVVDRLIIPNVHPQVIPAIRGTTDVKEIEAIGVIETFSISSCIIAADIARKAADVNLIEVRLAMGLGGKAYVTMTGEVGAVRTAVNAGCNALKGDGILISRTVIPKAHPGMGKVVL
ncbi:MAG: propanediol utilization protein [Caldiserica bacterium]|nr:MAG: propanediol utilization protein [Caldisericota bacterium]